MADKKDQDRNRGGFYQFTGKSADVTETSAGDLEEAAKIASESGIDLELNSDGERTTMTPKVLVVVPDRKNKI